MQQYSNEKENHFAYVGKMVFSEIGFMLLPFYYSYLLLCFFDENDCFYAIYGVIMTIQLTSPR